MCFEDSTKRLIGKGIDVGYSTFWALEEGIEVARMDNSDINFDITSMGNHPCD